MPHLTYRRKQAQRADHSRVLPAVEAACARILDGEPSAEELRVFLGAITLTAGFSKLSDELPTERAYLVSRGADPNRLTDEEKARWDATPTAEKRRVLARYRRAAEALDRAGVIPVTCGRRRERIMFRLIPAKTSPELVPVLSADIPKEIRRSIAAALRPSDRTRGALKVQTALVGDVLASGRFEADLNMVEIAQTTGLARNDLGRHFRALDAAVAFRYSPGAGRRAAHVAFGGVLEDGPGVPDPADLDEEDGGSNFRFPTLTRQAASSDSGALASDSGSLASDSGSVASDPARLLVPHRGPKTEDRFGGRLEPSPECDHMCQFYTDGECTTPHHAALQAQAGVGAP